ncbi:hypothetical protein [Humidesulfovibrio idahonensis]
MTGSSTRVTVPVFIPALCAKGVEVGEAAGVGVVVAPPYNEKGARQAGVRVKEPAREAQGQPNRIAARRHQISEGIILHRLYNTAVQIGKGQRRAQVVM